MPDLTTITYEHRGCSHEGERFISRPQVEGTAYFEVPPRCVETNAELVLVARL